jgi:hypothetical protein
MKRRALVLTSESARHPFRQSLPPHVLQPLPEPVGAQGKNEDLKLFLNGFAAVFVMTFCFVV